MSEQGDRIRSLSIQVLTAAHTQDDRESLTALVVATTHLAVILGCPGATLNEAVTAAYTEALRVTRLMRSASVEGHA